VPGSFDHKDLVSIAFESEDLYRSPGEASTPGIDGCLSRAVSAQRLTARRIDNVVKQDSAWHGANSGRLNHTGFVEALGANPTVVTQWISRDPSHGG
jgi:hypothetical protein